MVVVATLEEVAVATDNTVPSWRALCSPRAVLELPATRQPERRRPAGGTTRLTGLSESGYGAIARASERA